MAQREGGRDHKGTEETAEKEGETHCLDCGDGFTVISLYKHIKFYTFLSSKLYLFICLRGKGKGLGIEPAT